MKNPLREICTAGSVREELFGGAMVDLNGREAGNGRHGQVKPTALRTLLYSERQSLTIGARMSHWSSRLHLLGQGLWYTVLRDSHLG